jgi:hypothetical protein
MFHMNTSSTMSFNASMIAENERAEEELVRANLALFVEASEEATRECQRMKERREGKRRAMSSATAIVIMQ